MANFVAAADPASKTAYSFTDQDSLDHAIRDYGYIPLRADGTPMKVQSLEGGLLLDGAPLNVLLGSGWYQGQMELLQPLWANGTVPRPPAAVLGVEVLPMPPAIAAQTAAYVQTVGKSTGPLGLSWPAWLGLAAAGYFFFR